MIYKIISVLMYYSGKEVKKKQKNWHIKQSKIMFYKQITSKSLQNIIHFLII